MPMLECPACHGELSWTIEKRNKSHIEQAETRCASCNAVYPVQDGIGVFLTPDLPRQDLWEEGESMLSTYLREHPRIEQTLLETPLEQLPPANQFFRALALEERGAFADAKEAESAAHAGIYTKEYQDCFKSQLDYVAKVVSSGSAPIVDLASGRGFLVERLAREATCPIVATDFSPRVLRRDRRLFKFLGLADQAELLAFDARRTPFKDGAVKTMTTNLGLANIKKPGRLLHELRRVIDGKLLSIMSFFPDDDAANRAAAEKLGISSFMFRDSTLRLFDEAGF
ncbi:methyltransferase domain-containing protein, partial [Candidatus Bipolaricaulota bacterium]|nr:methyltransferase domain-containing protein [Candidatus Bipolaricaulota bacterium]